MEKIIIKKEKLKKMIEEWIHYPFYNGLDLEDFDEDIVIFDIDNFVRRIKKVKIRFTPPPPFFGDELMDFQEETKAKEEIYVGLLHAAEDIEKKLKRLVAIRKAASL